MNAVREVPILGVVGAGTLGVSLVQAGLAAGSPVTVLVRGGEEGAASRRRGIARALQRDVDRAALRPDQARLRLDRLRVTTDPADLAGAEVVLESVPENVAAKRAVIATVESVVDGNCLIASTTSSIPAATLAVGARRPERIVVTHYCWPAHRMPLVEVALHARCDATAKQRLEWLLASQGKQWLRTADRPGFLTTRALFAYWDGAIRLLCEGYDAAAVDEALERYGWPLGPFRVMDAAGVRSVVRINQWLAPLLGNRFTALALLSGMVDAGLDTFYHRDSDGRRRSRPEIGDHLWGLTGGTAPRQAGTPLLARVMNALAHEVTLAVAEGVLPSCEDAAAAYDLAFGFTGPNGGLRAWMTDVAIPGPGSSPSVPGRPFLAGATSTRHGSEQPCPS
ncbi:3-hydroxyacyl-CoA dehydrogenase family protein [Actinopolymorpha singaporensis]